MRPTPLLRILTAALASPLFVACVVPQGRYDAAMEKLHREEASRRTAEASLSEARLEVARVGQALAAREQRLSTTEGEVAQFKLDADRVATERDDAVLLVEQLRGELGRVGSNLREYSDEKRELEAALAEADTRAKRLDAAERRAGLSVILMRDLSLALGAEVSSGRVVVTAVDGKPAVRFPGKVFFVGKAGAVSSELVSVLERLAITVSAHASARVELSDLSEGPTAAEDRILRLQRVADVLAGKGLGFDRIGFAVVPVPPATASGTAVSPHEGFDGVQMVFDVGPATSAAG